MDMELPDYPQLEPEALDAETAIEDPESAITLMQSACENLNYLTDLYQCVKEEGVSKADVEDVLNIQEQYRDENGQLPVTSSLESYIGMFTAQRSTLNKKVSLEGIGTNILNTIRKWIDYLVDLVAKVIRWFKGYQHRDSHIQAKITTFKVKLKLIKVSYDSAIDANHRSDRDLTEQFKAISEQLLKDPSLPKTPVTRMFLGAIDQEKPFKYLSAAINEGVSQTRHVFDILEQNIKYEAESKQPGTYTATQVNINKLTFALENIRKFNAVSDNPDYLVDEIPWDFYKHLDKTLKLELPKYENIYVLYGDLADRLRNLKRINGQIEDEQRVEEIREIINVLTQAIKDLNELVQQCAEIRDAAFKAYATQFNYYVKAAKVIQQDYRSHVVGDIARKTYERFEQSLKDAAVALGI